MNKVWNGGSGIILIANIFCAIYLYDLCIQIKKGSLEHLTYVACVKQPDDSY